MEWTQGRTVEQKLARLANRAHGNVTRRALLRSGITRDEVKGRLKSGALIVEFPGVYRVGHRASSVHARYMAAVLACGEGALLCDDAAAHLLLLIKGSAPAPQVLTRTQRNITGITTRRARGKHKPRATKWAGIPTTTVPQTLVDLAAYLPLDDLARACHEAEARHKTTPAQVEAFLAKRPNAKGARNLRAVLRGETPVTPASSSAHSSTTSNERACRHPSRTSPPEPTASTAGGQTTT